jgi:hypothetical protein
MTNPTICFKSWFYGKYIQESVNTKFLGFKIDNRLNWTNHIDKLVPKLSGACCAVRSMLHVSDTDTLTHSNQFILPIFTP